MKLSQRKHDILCAAIDDYIKDACPITSGNVFKKQVVKLSPATLRNELNALEEMGFLKQLHTSGGRIPTAEGYKYYVNFLMENITVNPSSLQDIKQSLNKRTQSLSEIASEIAKIISRATNYPTAVLVNGYDKLIVEGITVVPLIERKALALIQTNNGYLNNTIDAPADKKACEDASKYLSKLFAGKTIGFLIENIELIKQGIEMQIQSFSSILDSVIENLKTLTHKPLLNIRHEHSKDLALSGNPEDMQKILALLSDEDKIASSLVEDEDMYVELEKQDDSLTGLALVKAPIILEGKQIASVGVFGPQRMNYAAITSALKLVVEELKGGQNGKKES
ncbi:MAG: hypothetical protein ACOX6H_00600 [Christensenellales bacterium]|jgi:heat-inducible transcriptional repressor